MSPLRDLPRLFAFTSTVDKFLMVVATVGAVGAGIGLPLVILIFGNMVNDFNNHAPGVQDADSSAITQATNRNLLVILYLFIGKLSLAYFATFVFRTAGIRTSAAIRSAYFEALMRHGVDAVDQISPGTAVERLGRIDLVQYGISERLASFFQTVASVIAGFTVALLHCWTLSLAMMTGVFVILLAIQVFMRLWTPLMLQVNHAYAGATSVAEETLRSIRTIKTLRAEEASIGRFRREVNNAELSGMKMVPVIAVQSGTVIAALNSSLALGLWLGVKLYVLGSLQNLGDIVIVFSSILLVTGQLSGILSPLQGLTEAGAASKAVFHTLDSARPATSGRPEDFDLSASDIRLEGVKFAYPATPESLALRSIDLCIRGGETTVLVGPSGCGKSTIVALLERWYELHEVREAGDATPSKDLQGRITIGGRSIGSFDLKWWRSQIGLVQQETYLFNDTIFINVALGLVGTPWENDTEEQKRTRVEEACQMALAHEFIQHLPDGYDTRVGDGGIKLSGGQRQRLSIARCIIKRAKILILDEATSAIDVQTEQVVQEALDRARKGRTTLMITHRLKVMDNMQRVIVMHNGCIVEAGTHEELLAAGGQYARMIETQKLTMPEAVSGENSNKKPDGGHRSEAPTQDLVSPASRSHMANIAAQGDSSQPRANAQAVRWHSVWQILKEQSHSLGFAYLTVLSSVCVAGAAFAMQPYLLGHYLTVFVRQRSSDLYSSGSFWALMVFVLGIVASLSNGILSASAHTLSVRTMGRVSVAYLAAIINQEASWFDSDEHACGTLVAQLSKDPRQLQQFIYVSFGSPISKFLGLIGCYALAFSQGWKLSAVVASAAIPTILGASCARTRSELRFASQNSAVFLESSKYAGEAVGALRTVTSLLLEDVFQKRYDALLQDHIREAARRARLACFLFALSDNADISCIALAFWYGSRLLARGEYTLLQFYIVYYALVQSSQAAGHFLAFASEIGPASDAATRILNAGSHQGDNERGTGDEKDEMHATCNGNGIEPANGTIAPGVEFRHVGFRYPTRQAQIYTSLSFAVGPGEFVGIVGPSGCGKTTILLLLAGLYAATSGEVLINGRLMNTHTTDGAKVGMALVSQEPTLITGSIRENLTFGLPEDRHTPQAELEEACRIVDVHDFVAGLPNAYETHLSAGSNIELSGGQKQRLCIARALVGKHRLLLLDEVTSNLDRHSEAAIQASIERLTANGHVTVLAVTHRLSLIRNAHRILVLGQNGAIAEQGVHDDLVLQKGAYWHMCQSAGWKVKDQAYCQAD